MWPGDSGACISREAPAWSTRRRQPHHRGYDPRCTTWAACAPTICWGSASPTRTPCFRPGAFLRLADREEGRRADGPAIHDGGGTKLGEHFIASRPGAVTATTKTPCSSNAVKEDICPVHIEEFGRGRDTKLGPEEITRDIPNVGEEMLRNSTSGHHPASARPWPEDISSARSRQGRNAIPRRKLLRHLRRQGPRRKEHVPRPAGAKVSSMKAVIDQPSPGEKDDAPGTSRPRKSAPRRQEQDHIRHRADA